MSFLYLIKNREIPVFFSKRWFLVWLKRLITFPLLLKIFMYRGLYSLLGVQIGRLTIIEGTTIRGKHDNLSIGNESFIAKDVNFGLHNRITIGSNVVINSGVKLLTGSHRLDSSSWHLITESIIIEDYAWIATNAVILPGVRIGKGAVVGAGAIVTKSIPDFSIVAGNPAKQLNRHRVESLNYSPVLGCSAYEAWVGNIFK